MNKKIIELNKMGVYMLLEIFNYSLVKLIIRHCCFHWRCYNKKKKWQRVYDTHSLKHAYLNV